MERLVETERDRATFIRFVERHKLPFRGAVKDGRERSYKQNNLQFIWAAYVAALPNADMTAGELQQMWKLEFGVPILMGENEEFTDFWAPLERAPYARRLEWMRWLQVTSLMSMSGFASYLDAIQRHYANDGIKLPVPEDMMWSGGGGGAGAGGSSQVGSACAPAVDK